MIVTDKFRRSTDDKLYVPTGKDLDPSGPGEEAAYYTLSGWIDSKFGPQGATVWDVYTEILRPKGLSQSDTQTLLHNSKRYGYLK